MYHVDIVGEANHAGTTPMALRRDAMSAAAQIALAVRRIAGEMEVCRVGTVGSMDVHPNAGNVIPGRVQMGVEFRDERMESLAGAEVELRRTAEEVAHAEQVAITVTAQRNTPSVPISGNMQQLIADAAGLAGLEHVSLPSGAGHDAQAIAAITPAAMVFVPSVGGISHAPAGVQHAGGLRQRSAGAAERGADGGRAVDRRTPASHLRPRGRAMETLNINSIFSKVFGLADAPE